MTITRGQIAKELRAYRVEKSIFDEFMREQERKFGQAGEAWDVMKRLLVPSAPEPPLPYPAIPKRIVSAAPQSAAVADAKLFTLPPLPGARYRVQLGTSLDKRKVRSTSLLLVTVAF